MLEKPKFFKTYRSVFFILAVVWGLVCVALALSGKVGAVSGDVHGNWQLLSPYVGSDPPSGQFYLYSDALDVQFVVVNKIDAGSNNVSTGFGTLATGSLLGECTASCATAPWDFFIATFSTPRWDDSTVYVTGQTLNNDGSIYTAVDDHTSTALDEPGTGLSWEDHWNLVGANATAFSFEATEDNYYVLEGGETMHLTWNPSDFVYPSCPEGTVGTYPTCTEPPPTETSTVIISDETIAKMGAIFLMFWIIKTVAGLFRYQR